MSGLVPIPEIQYLAYLHNAEDQLRGEAASLSFFSNGQYRNPLVVRIAGYGYQKGFGGHFHNDNAVAVLRDIPGLVIASPARPADAAPMLRTCVAAADADGTVSVFLEPIALYHTRDLHDAGDERLDGAVRRARPRGPTTHVPIGAPAVARDGDDVLIVTLANGLYLSLRVADRLAARGHRAAACSTCAGWRRCRSRTSPATPPRSGGSWSSTRPGASGGVGEAVVAALVEPTASRARCAASPPHDSFIPLGDAADLVLVARTTSTPPSARLTDHPTCSRCGIASRTFDADPGRIRAVRSRPGALLGEGGHALGGVGTGEQLVGQCAHPLERRQLASSVGTSRSRRLVAATARRAPARMPAHSAGDGGVDARRPTTAGSRARPRGRGRRRTARR